jgi:putative oxidoreductase
MNFLEKFKPIALLLLRCALGIIFMTHGYPKLFGQAPNAPPIVPPSASLSYLAGVIELFGGSLVILGLFTRAAALFLAADMGVVVWKLLEAMGYLGVKRYEVPLILFAASLALATVGPGSISIDQPLFASAPRRKTIKK